MRCSKCSNIFDPNEQTVICPHPHLDKIPAPTGGFRFPPEIRDEIEIALLRSDREALNEFRYHRNPLVRAYVTKIIEVFPDNA